MSSSIRMRSGDMVISFGCSSAGDRRLPPEGCPQSGHHAAFIPSLGEAVPSNDSLPELGPDADGDHVLRYLLAKADPRVVPLADYIGQAVVVGEFHLDVR